MNKYIIIISLLVAGVSSAQVSIEKTLTRGSSTLLDFNDMVEANGVAKGIILPIVDDVSTAEQGTLLLDASTDKVRYKNATEWVDLTESATTDFASPALDDIGEGAIIGDGTTSFTDDTAPAVLKLSSSEKAMILPHVNSITEVSDPEPGTIVYEANSKSLAIFNGNQWYFWN